MRGKRPTVRQKKLMKEWKLNPDDWLVTRSLMSKPKAQRISRRAENTYRVCGELHGANAIEGASYPKYNQMMRPRLVASDTHERMVIKHRNSDRTVRTIWKVRYIWNLESGYSI